MGGQGNNVVVAPKPMKKLSADLHGTTSASSGNENENQIFDAARLERKRMRAIRRKILRSMVAKDPKSTSFRRFVIGFLIISIIVGFSGFIVNKLLYLDYVQSLTQL